MNNVEKWSKLFLYMTIPEAIEEINELWIDRKYIIEVTIKDTRREVRDENKSSP